MRTARAILSLVVILSMVPSARAAVVTISSADGANVSHDLTTVFGTTDWAYWAQTASTVVATAAPSNDKLAATAIGSLTNFGGAGIRGSTSTSKPPYDFEYTNGTSPTSGTVSDIIGMFNSTLGGTGNGLGVQLDVIAPSAEPFVIYVWGTGFQARGNLTATAGAASQTDSTMVHAGVRSPGKLYTINVTPDSVGQTVNIKMVQSDSTDGNSNVSISAVAVVVPEPSTLALVAVGSLALALRRPRSRN